MKKLNFIQVGIGSLAMVAFLTFSGCSTNPHRVQVRHRHHRLAHIAMHQGDANAADKMAKEHGGDHSKAHVLMHGGDAHAAYQHAAEYAGKERANK